MNPFNFVRITVSALISQGYSARLVTEPVAAPSLIYKSRATRDGSKVGPNASIF